MFGESHLHNEVGRDLPVRVWRLCPPMLSGSTASFGGGVGVRDWNINAEVAHDYHRVDVAVHVHELVGQLGLTGSGVAMLTAAAVARYRQACDHGVEVEVTAGLSHATWAAAPDDTDREPAFGSSAIGTINIVATLPVRLEEGALLNAIATATEAKSQALFELGIPATGTPTDAVCILCPVDDEVEPFAGPRSRWGARLARAVHVAVLDAAAQWPA